MKKADLLEIIANGENSGVEFKLDDIRPEQLAKEIVALANFRGGRILMGVADDGTIHGIARENLEAWVMDTVFARYVHPMMLPFYEEIRMDDGKRVAVISFPRESLNHMYLEAKTAKTFIFEWAALRARRRGNSRRVYLPWVECSTSS